MDNILSSDKGNKEFSFYQCVLATYGDPWNLDVVNEWVFKLNGVNTS